MFGLTDIDVGLISLKSLKSELRTESALILIGQSQEDIDKLSPAVAGFYIRFSFS